VKKRKDEHNLKVVILAGGLGTRLREETEFKPKPMVEIGGKPILWHLMKYFSKYGHSEFIVCVGYKGNIIKQYFMNYRALNSDIKVDFGKNEITYQRAFDFLDDWNVVVTDTGDLTSTGGRLFQAQEYVGNERFLCTYGDGLSNVDLEKLLSFHEAHGRIATFTATKPQSRFGLAEVDEVGQVISFTEKPILDSWVNAGFFIFEPQIFQYLNSDCVLEEDALKALAFKRELMAFRHDGFWQPMDTYRESLALNKLWDEANAPWKIW